MEPRHSYHQELDRLTQEVLDMGRLVRTAIDEASRALQTHDASAAASVIDGDRHIDAAELVIEDRCVALMATEQPVATDLRRLVMVLKVVTQLERMGDHALHIAKAARRLAGTGKLPFPQELSRMAEACLSMLDSALRAVAGSDPEEARRLAQADEAVDAMHEQTVRELVSRMRRQPDAIETCLELIQVSRFLERLADHATNIGEWVVYEGTARHVSLNP